MVLAGGCAVRGTGVVFFSDDWCVYVLRGVKLVPWGHAFFHCGWVHILHEPHLFFVLPLVDRGVFGSVALPAGECFPDLVI